MRSVFGLSESAAVGTDEDIARMSAVLSQKVTGKESQLTATVPARDRLDPKKVLNMCVIAPAFKTGRTVEVPDLLLQSISKPSRCFPVRLQVEMLDFLPDNPIRHGVDVAAQYLATDAVGLHERRSAAHEGIGYAEALQVMTFVKGLSQAGIHEFREQECSEQRSRPTRKPFMHGNRRPVVLLYLLLAQSQAGNKWNVEKSFYHEDLPVEGSYHCQT